jgi:hypothetical protein
MAFKLKVGNTLSIPVKLEINDGASKPAAFNFKLTAARMSADEACAQFEVGGENADRTVADFLHEKITDWSGQTLVLDDDTGQPVPFSREAFTAMLSLVGVANVIYGAYVTELLKAAPAEAARKN